MRLEILGYNSRLFFIFLNKLKKCKNYKFKGDLLNFYKATSPMTQKLYLEITRYFVPENKTCAMELLTYILYVPLFAASFVFFAIVICEWIGG